MPTQSECVSWLNNNNVFDVHCQEEIKKQKDPDGDWFDGSTETFSSCAELCLRFSRASFGGQWKLFSEWQNGVMNQPATMRGNGSDEGGQGTEGDWDEWGWKSSRTACQARGELRAHCNWRRVTANESGLIQMTTGTWNRGWQGARRWRKHMKTTVASEIGQGVEHCGRLKNESPGSEFLTNLALGINFCIFTSDWLQNTVIPGIWTCYCLGS